MAARTNRLVPALAAAALIVAGCGSDQNDDTAAGPTKTHAAPATTVPPTAVPSRSAPKPKPTPTRSPPEVRFPASLPRSIPTSVSIPAIGVEATTIRLGLNTDGSVQTPPSSPDQVTGWFERSPTPGELGAPSVLLGHIDSHRYGPEVFYRLRELRPGDVIEVGRHDGTSAKFAVDRVEQYAKSQFPKVRVYGGGSALDRPGIRLITCGGAFDAATRSYLDNIVAFGTLVS